jgi:hypothetical protein
MNELKNFKTIQFVTNGKRPIQWAEKKTETLFQISTHGRISMYFHMNFEPYRQFGIRCFCFVLQIYAKHLLIIKGTFLYYVTV